MASEELPPSVERALAAARADSARSRQGRWLALIPVTALLVTFPLVMPRATVPTSIPLPQIDGVVLRAVVEGDMARSKQARESRLPGDILAVGTALRSINKAAADRTSDATGGSRAVLDAAMRGLGGYEPNRAIDLLKTLRAVQLEDFLAEVRRFEETGEPSPDLLELGGPFVERMRDGGWVQGRNVLLDDAQRRAAFKAVWTAMVGGDRVPELKLTVDEQRALYTLYLRRPHVPDAQRASFALMRRGAATDAECRNVAAKERLAAELWRAEKIRKLGEIDADYPADYALGVAYYRAGRYDMSTEAFHTWLDRHPDGPLALRARNHWKAAKLADGSI